MPRKAKAIFQFPVPVITHVRERTKRHFSSPCLESLVPEKRQSDIPVLGALGHPCPEKPKRHFSSESPGSPMPEKAKRQFSPESPGLPMPEKAKRHCGSRSPGSPHNGKPGQTWKTGKTGQTWKTSKTGITGKTRIKKHQFESQKPSESFLPL